MSWGRGQTDPMALCELRTRADAYEAIEAATYDRLCDVHGVKPLESE